MESHVGNHTGSFSSCSFHLTHFFVFAPLFYYSCPSSFAWKHEPFFRKWLRVEISCLEHDFPRPRAFSLCPFVRAFIQFFWVEKDPSQWHTHVIWIAWIGCFQVNRTMGRRDRLSTRVFEKWRKVKQGPFLGIAILWFYAILPTGG